MYNLYYTTIEHSGHQMLPHEKENLFSDSGTECFVLYYLYKEIK